jgi:putative ABC transport system permease protein
MVLKIAWKNIWFKPLNTVLSLVLLTASVAIISLLILLQNQFEKQFTSTIEGVDMVLGAPGSPLQLILSSVYHIDAPTGNINYKEAKTWMQHPMVKQAIPMAFGDSYKGYKILGTTHDYLTKYQAELATGTLYQKNFEVVLGAAIAENLGLKLGSSFHGTHGEAEEGHVHEEFSYQVVGILKPTGKVIDHLVLCNIESVWAVHAPENHDNTVVYEDEAGNTLAQDTDAVQTHANQEITAVLIKFKNKMGIISWGRLVAQNTKMMAALPAVEINRLFSLFGIGLDALQYLALGIMLISGISIFVALYNTLKERKYEFALMRISGASRGQLLKMVLIESLLLCCVGFVFGTALGRLALVYISQNTTDQYNMAFDATIILWEKEGYLFMVTIFVGFIAALIPAIKAYRLNISKTLAHA